MAKKIIFLLGVLLLNLVINSSVVISQTEKPIFKYGVTSDPETIDPAQAWDSTSIDIIDQVCEGLVAYDLFDPELALIPRLATNLGTWNEEADEVTFSLRQDVTFHDGMPFNATAVKYTFDRLNNLFELGESQIADLYTPLAPLYPDTPLIINNTVVVNEFTVKFILNYPYVPFISLLSFSGSYIVHPEIPFNRMIDLDEPLIGTGPYILDYYIGNATHFLAYPDYYRPQPDIQEMLWIHYDDYVALAQAFFSGDIHMPDVYFAGLREYCYCGDYSNIHVDPPKNGTCIYYLGMNNEIINQTFRQVISYSIDYNYIIFTIMNSQVNRMTSVIPAGILYHDPIVASAGYDLKKARQILVDHDLAGGLSPTSSDLEWYNLTETSPIATFNYTYNLGNRVRGDIGLLLQRNLKLVGIKFNIEGLTLAEWINRCPCGFCAPLPIFFVGWCPDYNDPSTYINSLMSNTSLSNYAEINDPWLQNAMMQAVVETNITSRRVLYSEIQHYIAEDLMPWAFLYTSNSVAAWNNQLGNVPQNPMNKLYFYPCTWYHTNTTSTITTETTSTSDTSTTTPSIFISGNVGIILLSLCCISVALAYVLPKKSRRMK